MLAIFTKNAIYFLASSRKALFFQPVASDKPIGSVPPVTVLTREKVSIWMLFCCFLFSLPLF